MLENSEAPRREEKLKLPRPSLLAFARFLGERWLVNYFRWKRGPILRLPPVNPSFGSNFSAMFFSRQPEFAAHPGTGRNGRGELRGSGQRAGCWIWAAATRLRRFGNRRGGGRRARLGKFRSGNPATAEKGSGKSLEAEIFVVPTARSRSTRWWRWTT